MVGQFSLAMAMTYPVALFANLQLRTLYVNDFDGRYPFASLLGLRFVLCGIALVVILTICEVTGQSLRMTVATLFVEGAMLVDCISESYYGLCQCDERMDRIARSVLFRSMLCLLLFGLCLYFTHSLVWSTGGLLVGRAFILLIYDASLKTFAISETALSRVATHTRPRLNTLLDRLRPQWNPRLQLSMAGAAAPIGALSLITSLNINIPRYVIERYLGLRELGIYSALNYLPQAGLMIATALGFATFARLSRMYATGDVAGIHRLVLKTAGLAAGLGVVGFVVVLGAGRQLLTILYRPEYANRSDVLLWLVAVAAVACLATCFGCATTAMSQYGRSLLVTLIVSVVSTAASFIFIPRFGLCGAGCAALLSISVQFVGTAGLAYYALARRAQQIFTEAQILL
jgi:O-antigen/teichoic acid export membrane protein